MTHRTVSRRTMLVASATSLSGLSGLASGILRAADDDRPSSPLGQAKSTILFFLCGGASHIDTWDMKPDAPAEYRGPFAPIATSAQGIRLCEHWPMLARQAHHLVLVNSVDGRVNTNDHHAGYYYNLTGHVPDVTGRIVQQATPYSEECFLVDVPLLDFETLFTHGGDRLPLAGLAIIVLWGWRRGRR